MKDNLRFTLTAMVWAVILFAAYALAIHPQSGRIHADDYTPQSVSDLDTSFGNGGKVMTQVKVAGNGGSTASGVAIQNNGEMRDQGMVLSFAVISAVDGRVSLVRNDSINCFTASGQLPS